MVLEAENSGPMRRFTVRNLVVAELPSIVGLGISGLGQGERSPGFYSETIWPHGEHVIESWTHRNGTALDRS